MDFEKRLHKKMSKSKKARKPRDDDDSDDEPEKKPFGRDRLKEIRNPDQNMFSLQLPVVSLTFYEWP